jgi:hypothetical protein
MKTRKISATANAPTPNRARVHAFMVIAGVLIAIACALVLLQEAPSLPQIGASKLSIGEVSKLTSLARVASLWQF